MNSVIKDMRRNGASEAEIAMYKAHSDSPIYNKKNRFQVLKIVGITLVVAIVLGVTFFALSLILHHQYHKSIVILIALNHSKVLAN